MKKLLVIYAATIAGLLGISQKMQAQGFPLQANITATTNVACNGGNTANSTVTATGGISPYTYSWNPGNQTNTTATGLTAGTYTIMVTDLAASTATASVAITQPTTLTYVSSTTNVSCYLAYNGEAGVTVTGGVSPYTYYWAPVGSTSNIINGLGAGTYTMTINDANGCAAQTTTTITEPPALVVSASAASAIAMSLAAGGTSPYTYSWSGGGTSSIRTGLTAGTYTVTVHDAHLCSDSALVKVARRRVAAADTTIMFTFAHDTTTCMNPNSYFEFDIMAASNVDTWFDGCTILLAYNPAAFGTYIYNNNANQELNN